MKKIYRLETFSVGLAMFAMFFGAGNVIFPLGLGQHAQDQSPIATFGLLLTAVLMPFAGVFAMILYDGNCRKFFERIGKIPGFLLAFTIITLLGPAGSTPRCIALTYSTLKSSFPELSSTLFSGFACLIIFAFTLQKQRVITLLGYVLTPLLILSLTMIVAIGIYAPSHVQASGQSPLAMFMHGLSEGYNTMDLLAAFFFSSAILAVLREKQTITSNYINIAFKASIIGAILLAAVYIGFSSIAAFHGADLPVTNKDELLSALTLRIAGPYANMLVCMTVVLACLTTAIALISVFADFFQKEVLRGKISYETTLIGSLLMTFAVSTLQFTGISSFLGPVLQICYPALIVLTLLNIAYKLTGFRPVKVPVFAAFALSAFLYFQ